MSNEKPSRTTLQSSRYYNLIFSAVLIGCVALVTWLFKSGAYSIWQKHPSSGGPHEAMGWFGAVVFGLIGGVVLGLLIILQIDYAVERWSKRRAKAKSN
jgi:uncharacterized membrane protein